MILALLIVIAILVLVVAGLVALLCSIKVWPS